MLGKEKQEELQKRLKRLGVRDLDLVEKFILGSGSGGQKINKTSSCVYLKHLPSGIEVKCQRDRSRELNRFHARKSLCEQLEKQIEGKRSEQEQKREKIRRQKRRRSRKSKEKMLEGKRALSHKKSMRQEPKQGGD
jgi:protein subunit release factor B